VNAEERKQADDDDRAILFDLLLTRAFQKRKVMLSSGKESDFYIDCKKALTSDGLISIGSLFCYEIHRRFGRNIDGVGGLTMGADPLAVATCMTAWRCGFTQWNPFYIRKEPKKHGTEAWLEGPTFSEGARVVIVEDVITTGASTLKAIQRTRAHWLNPIFVLALVDRQEEHGRQNIENEGIPVHVLFTRADFPV